MATTRFTVALAFAVLPIAGLAEAANHDEAAGRVMAAGWIADRCDGIATIGNGDNQSFVIAASDLLATQGYRGNRMRKLLFYASTDSLEALGREVLAARGVEANDEAALCRFGIGIVGTNDTIGQFLVKGD
jgi:Family of unknown function (DUF5333)